MFKLLGATLIAAGTVACAKGGNEVSSGGSPHADSVMLSAPGGTNFTLQNGPGVTPSAPAPTAVASDSVVVIGGQQCPIIVKEILPPTVPPKYRVVVKC